MNFGSALKLEYLFRIRFGILNTSEGGFPLFHPIVWTVGQFAKENLYVEKIVFKILNGHG